MLQMYHKYVYIISQSFQNDTLFANAFEKTYFDIINRHIKAKHPSGSPDLIVKYCDSLLRESKTTEIEIELKIVGLITILKYVEDKNFYFELYSHMLAKRLISKQLHSVDIEEAVINQLSVSRYSKSNLILLSLSPFFKHMFFSHRHFS